MVRIPGYVPRETRLTDRTGIVYLRLRQVVRLTHPRHSYAGEIGRVTEIDPINRRVRVRLDSDPETLVWASHRSVEVPLPEER